MLHNIMVALTVYSQDARMITEEKNNKTYDGGARYERNNVACDAEREACAIVEHFTRRYLFRLTF